MGDISPHFSRHEFRCRCETCGLDTIDVMTIKLCEIVRGMVDGPVQVSSGQRCAIRNAAEGGAPNSQHLYGRAADLAVSNPKWVYERLCEAFPNQFGFGLYTTFVHVDSRGGPAARWTG